MYFDFSKTLGKISPVLSDKMAKDTYKLEDNAWAILFLPFILETFKYKQKQNGRMNLYVSVI